MILQLFIFMCTHSYIKEVGAILLTCKRSLNLICAQQCAAPVPQISPLESLKFHLIYS